jgi:hypothetical protein
MLYSTALINTAEKSYVIGTLYTSNAVEHVDAPFTNNIRKMLWPCNFLNHNGLDWICKICGEIANHKKGLSDTLRENARYYHTVQRCAQGLRSKPTLIKNEAEKRVKQEAEGCYAEFISFIDNVDLHEHGGNRVR